MNICKDFGFISKTLKFSTNCRCNGRYGCRYNGTVITVTAPLTVPLTAR